MGGDGVEGSTLAFRLQRPFVIVQEFQKEALYIMMMFKISCLSILIYDILKHALAIFAWQCRGSGVLHTRRTTNKGFLRMPKIILPKIKIKCNFFITFF